VVFPRGCFRVPPTRPFPIRSCLQPDCSPSHPNFCCSLRVLCAVSSELIQSFHPSSPILSIHLFNPSSITINGILPQPHGRTSIVSGLNYITRIFALLGEILVRIRVDKRSPPQGPFAIARLEEVRSLHTRILDALTQCPGPLRLKSVGPGGSGVMGMGPVGGIGGVLNGEWPGGAGFRQATFAEVRELFDNPKASRTNASNPFLVMQANLYVTQVRSSRHITPFGLVE
jgi:hypothetical protein